MQVIIDETFNPGFMTKKKKMVNRKKFEISGTDPNAPEELFFVHIKIEDMDSIVTARVMLKQKQSNVKNKQTNYFEE